MDADSNQPKKAEPAHPKHSGNGTPENTGDDPLPNSAVDDFFVKMNHDFRRPRPSDEAVAAALHAIQTLAGDAAEHDVEAAAVQDLSSDDSATATAGALCPKCRAVNFGTNRFCGYCGALITRREKLATGAAAPGALIHEPPTRDQTAREQHIHHHHHHYFPGSEGKHSVTAEGKAALVGELAPSPPISVAAAETAIQKLVSDWTMCCNSKRLDDLLALYSPDAIVLRANVAPAHGRTAIRLVLQAVLQEGLGDVELDPADAGVLGDIACLTGRSRMLVPTAPGKRREETGKFLIVARRESGEWKILADSWCIDSPRVDSPPSAPAPPAPAPVARTPRIK